MQSEIIFSSKRFKASGDALAGWSIDTYIAVFQETLEPCLFSRFNQVYRAPSPENPWWIKMLTSNSSTNNLTYFQHDSLTEIRTYGIILILLIIVGLWANFVVVISILINKKLRGESINLLILSLCAGDFIILLMDRPLLVALFLSPVSLLGNLLCAIETFCESVGICVLLISMGILGLERFLTIQRPLEISVKKTRIQRFIVFSWICALFSGFTVLFFDEPSFHYQYCQRRPYRTFGHFDYMVIPLGAFTTLFTAVMYTMIMRLVRVHVSAVASTLGNEGSTLTVGKSSTLSRIFPVLNKPAVEKSDAPPNLVEVFDHEGNKTLEPAAPETAGAVCKFNPKNREAARRKMELSTAKKSLAIVASSFLCWLPLPLVHCHRAVSSDANRGAEWWWFIPTVTFTLLAVVNPVVYAFVNKQMRQSARHLWENSISMFRTQKSVSSWNHWDFQIFLCIKASALWKDSFCVTITIRETMSKK